MCLSTAQSVLLETIDKQLLSRLTDFVCKVTPPLQRLPPPPLHLLQTKIFFGGKYFHKMPYMLQTKQK